MTASKYISELDTRRFGIKVAKLPNDLNSIIDLLNSFELLSVKLVIARADLDNIRKIQELQQLDFKLMDVQLTYKISKSLINSKSDLLLNPNVIVREFHNSDLETLKKIAYQSFDNYGHYSVDPKIDKAKAREIYIDWIERACLDKQVADIVYVAEYEKNPIGFLSFKILNTNETFYAAGVIGAVDSNFRNMNVFKHLIKFGNNWAINMKADWIEHNVLANNFAVNNSFISSGFKISKSFVTMHKWI